ncbi:hypothetical protein MD484_g8766, partial [Candolleomyces efflorescens]
MVNPFKKGLNLSHLRYNARQNQFSLFQTFPDGTQDGIHWFAVDEVRDFFRLHGHMLLEPGFYEGKAGAVSNFALTKMGDQSSDRNFPSNPRISTSTWSAAVARRRLVPGSGRSERPAKKAPVSKEERELARMRDIVTTGFELHLKKTALDLKEKESRFNFHKRKNGCGGFGARGRGGGAGGHQVGIQGWGEQQQAVAEWAGAAWATPNQVQGPPTTVYVPSKRTMSPPPARMLDVAGTAPAQVGQTAYGNGSVGVNVAGAGGFTGYAVQTDAQAENAAVVPGGGAAERAVTQGEAQQRDASTTSFGVAANAGGGLAVGPSQGLVDQNDPDLAAGAGVAGSSTGAPGNTTHRIIAGPDGSAGMHIGSLFPAPNFSNGAVSGQESELQAQGAPVQEDVGRGDVVN